MGFRITPLTMLFCLSGFIMLVSHRYFLVDSPTRVITQPRRWGARPNHRHTAVEEEEDGVMSLNAIQVDGPGERINEDEGLTSMIARNEANRQKHAADDTADDDAEDEDDDDDEDDAEDKEEGEQPAGTAAGGGGVADSYSAIVRAAEGSLDPYPTAAVEFECTPPVHARPTRKLDYITPPDSTFPTNCKGREDLCEVVKKTAIDRKVLVAVCNSGIITQLSKWVESNRRAKIENMMIVAIDAQLPKWLDENKVAYWRRTTSAAGSHKISAQKFQYVREFLSIGCSVLMSDIDVVYLQNPFLFLHNDADVEGTTDGWDDGSAYGWTEHLDDPSMGAVGRFRPAMRITAWNSGLWYIAATHAGMRLMSILAHRMATEDTWDQAAFGEEVTRPARDDHLASGITKRALNHWCFCNSKTLFRRIRTEARFAEHRPVVVHANYHQPKPPRMTAVYDRWHLGDKTALDRFRGEQGFTVPAPTLEKDFLHQINDGFVSGSNTRDASAAIASGGCKPKPSKHGLSMNLHARGRVACESSDSLCAAAAAVAKLWTSKTTGIDGQPVTTSDLVLVVGGSSQVEEIRLLLSSAKRASVSNLLLLLTDQGAHDALGSDAPPIVTAKTADQYEGRDEPVSIVQSVDSLLVLAGDAAGTTHTEGALGVAIARYHVLARLLAHGFGVLSVSPATVLLANPFEHLYRDADIEAMSTGWDDGSAYGYNHVLDDPSMGFTRFCHGSRIVSYEPGFFFAMPTTESIALTARMATQLARPAAKLSTTSTAHEVSAAEREALLHELWLPSHHEYASVGAILRVMNYMCFVNSKVLFRQLRMLPNSPSPVAVQMNYHSDAVPRMRATIARYLDSDSEPLKQLPLADASGSSKGAEPPLSCERVVGDGDSSSRLGAHLIAHSPYAWGGVGDMKFEDGGVLDTPWGKGQWAIHAGDSSGLSVAADFVGAKHNVRFDLATGMGVSTRCSDSNVVLVRSIKEAKKKAG